MKKAIVIPAVSLVTVGLIGTGAVLLVPKEAQVNINSTPQTVQEAPQEPEPVKTNEEPVSEPQTVQEPVQPVQEESVPTNEELAKQYAWDRMAGGLGEYGMVWNYTERWPQYFTEDERTAAFKYMHDTGVALCGMWNLPQDSRSANYCFMKFMQSPLGDPRLDDWVRIGRVTGVDTSHYE